MSELVERLRAPLGVMKCEVSTGPAPENRLERRWLLALEAAARIEQLEAALREIMGMDEVTIVEFKKGDGWLHQRVARAALEGKPNE